MTFRTATPLALGTVQVTSGATVPLTAGSYSINGLTLNGEAILRIVSGPVILNVAGVGKETPLDFQRGALSSLTFNSSSFRILYAGTGAVNFTGGRTTAALVYAPAATSHLSGESEFYGSILASFVSLEGSSHVHYDRRLVDLGVGPAMLRRFTWKQY